MQAINQGLTLLELLIAMPVLAVAMTLFSQTLIAMFNQRAINRENRAAVNALADADLVLFLTEATRWTDEDADVLKKIRKARVPAVAVLNKVDLVKPKEKLLAIIAETSRRREFADIVPLSASKSDNLDALLVDAGVRDAEPETPGAQPMIYIQAIDNGQGGTSTQGAPDEDVEGARRQRTPQQRQRVLRAQGAPLPGGRRFVGAGDGRGVQPADG